MKRYSSILAVLIVLILPAVCFGGSLVSVPCSADHFGLLHRQITQMLARVTETLEPAWSVTPEKNADYTQTGNVLAPPANDNFANRAHLAGDTGMSIVDDTEATYESGEPFHFLFDFGRNTIWYTWTAPYSGTFGFDTHNSAVSTFVALYRGSSLTNLTRVSSGYPLYTGITAPAGAVYQIAVMGATPTSKGVTQLRYYPDSVGGNTNLGVSTNTIIQLLPSSDGSIAYAVSKTVVTASSPTNRYGYPANPGLWFNLYPRGLNIYDRKNTALVVNSWPDDAGVNYMLLDFDGKQLLLYNQVTLKLLLYRLTRQGLTKVGEATVPNVGGAKMQGSYIYAIQISPDSYVSGQATMGLQAFDKRLKRKKWQLPFEKGSIKIHFNTGYAYRFISEPYTQRLFGYKKGTEQNRVNIDYSFTEYTEVQTDPFGNMLTWHESGGYPFFTNSLLTYISRKGETVFSNRTLPDAGTAWAFGGFEKSRLYIIRPNGPTQIAAGYKLGKTISQTGNQQLSDYRYAEFADRKFTVYRSSGLDSEGFIQYDKNIKKETWNEPISQGSMENLGKGSFGRARMIPGIGSTNYIITIFNHKKAIADHQIVN